MHFPLCKRTRGFRARVTSVPRARLLINIVFAHWPQAPCASRAKKIQSDKRKRPILSPPVCLQAIDGILRVSVFMCVCVCVWCVCSSRLFVCGWHCGGWEIHSICIFVCRIYFYGVLKINRNTVHKLSFPVHKNPRVFHPVLQRFIQKIYLNLKVLFNKTIQQKLIELCV